MKHILIGGLVIVIGICLIFFSYYTMNSIDYSKSNRNLVSLTSYLLTDPLYFHKPAGKTGWSDAIRIILERYPGILFDNGGVFLDATDYKAILQELKAGDTVSIKVLKTELAKFGQADVPQSMSERFSIPSHLEFYSLIFKGKEYVTELENKAKSADQGLMVVAIIFGILFIIFGLQKMIFKR